MNENENKDTEPVEVEGMRKSYDPHKKDVRHIVISGGGIAGFSYYGALQESSKQGVWNIENIQTIYGTSIGSIISVMLALKYDWQTLDDYLIKRPWQNVFKFDMYSVLGSINTRGIFDIKVIEDIFTPLFSGKDISINITMKEFFELSNIEIHVFSIEVNSFKLVDISYKTHPDWKVVEAVYASSSLPIIFAPFIKDDVFYCDGGLLANYPLSQCIDNGANMLEILGIGRSVVEPENKLVTKDSTLIDYMLTIFNKSVERIIWFRPVYPILIEYLLPSYSMSISAIYNTAINMDERISMIENGKRVADEHANSFD